MVLLGACISPAHGGGGLKAAVSLQTISPSTAKPDVPWDCQSVSSIASSIKSEVVQAIKEHKDSPDDSWKRRTQLKIAKRVVALDMKTAFYVGLALNGFCATGYIGWGVGAIGVALCLHPVATGGLAWGAFMTGVAPFLHTIGGVGMVYGAPAVPAIQRRLNRCMPHTMIEFERLMEEARNHRD